MTKPTALSGQPRTRRHSPGTTPLVAAVITGRISTGAISKAASLGAGLLEIRVDTFAVTQPAKLVEAFKKLKKNTRLPILLTIRSSREGGQSSMSEKERADLYEALIPHSDMVDIELASAIRKGVIHLARRAKKPVVVSYHDFKATPGDKRLARVAAQARSAGADIVKIAAMVRSGSDLKRLASLLCTGEDLVVIGMGPLGRPSRVFFPMLGSLIAYCPVTEGTAPGQLGLKEMRSELSRYGFQGS